MRLLILWLFAFCFYPSLGQTSNKKTNDTSRSIEVKGLLQTHPVQDSMINLPPQNSSISGFSEKINAQLPSKTSLMSSYEFGLSLGVLGFGIFLIILEIILIKGKAISEDLLVKFILVTLIITATLFLITAGYDNNQIAPAIGLFGTVAGYLLGKASNKNSNAES
ncbi:MAG: hypothetical protein JST81_01215 [Bacteroidetes bacterium]|jgi:hypothetical protein|nr:hypothetical protein [Bacteroidota bacterium]